MSNLQMLAIAAVAAFVAFFLYMYRPWRRWRRYDWIILNGFGPGQFKTPYPMSVYGAARYAAAVGWSVTHIDYERKTLLVKKRA